MLEIELKCKVIYTPNLSLAIYRELATHLAQIEQISTELIGQDNPKFDYADSQISGMWIHYPQAMPQNLYQLAQEILSHYGNWTAEPKLFVTAIPELLANANS